MPGDMKGYTEGEWRIKVVMELKNIYEKFSTIQSGLEGVRGAMEKAQEKLDVIPNLEAIKEGHDNNEARILALEKEFNQLKGSYSLVTKIITGALVALIGFFIWFIQQGPRIVRVEVPAKKVGTTLSPKPKPPKSVLATRESPKKLVRR